MTSTLSSLSLGTLDVASMCETTAFVLRVVIYLCVGVPLPTFWLCGKSGSNFRDASMGRRLLSVESKHKSGLHSSFHAADLNLISSLASNIRVMCLSSAHFTIALPFGSQSLYFHCS